LWDSYSGKAVKVFSYFAAPTYVIFYVKKKYEKTGKSIKKWDYKKSQPDLLSTLFLSIGKEKN